MWDLSVIIALNDKEMQKYQHSQSQRIQKQTASEVFHFKSSKLVKRSLLLVPFPAVRDQALHLVAIQWPWDDGFYTTREDFIKSLFIDVKYVLPKVTGRVSRWKRAIDIWVVKKVISIMIKEWWPKDGNLTTLSMLDRD